MPKPILPQRAFIRAKDGHISGCGWVCRAFRCQAEVNGTAGHEPTGGKIRIVAAETRRGAEFQRSPRAVEAEGRVGMPDRLGFMSC